jgi:lipopolysaccharide biosynthesis glycosyltransferase
MPNGGLQVVNPSNDIYDTILDRMSQSSSVENYEFADQSLLSDVFKGRWVGLPYIYNALKTIRWKGVHDPIWRDGKVKNIHYILSPKPWDEEVGEGQDPTHAWWHKRNQERRNREKDMGIDDGL